MSDKLPPPRIVQDTLGPWSNEAPVYYLAVVPCWTRKEAEATIKRAKKKEKS